MKRHITLVLALASVLVVSSARAQSNWQVRRWQAYDGVPASITALTQTSDGFIWIGSLTGLYRFDGVSFERLPAAQGDAQSEGVIALSPDGHGGLWAGHENGGVSYYRSGAQKAVEVSGTDRVFHQLVRSPDGGLLGVGADNEASYVDRLAKGKWSRMVTAPAAIQPQDAVMGADGTLWLLGGGKLRYVRPGGHILLSTSIDAGTEARLARDGQGRTWLLADGKLFELVPGRGAEPAVGRFRTRLGRSSSLSSLLFDDRGDLWRLSAADGLVRYSGRDFRPLDPDGRRPSMAPTQTTATPPTLVDREGSVWIATEGGLDQYVKSAFSVPKGFDQPVTQQWAGRMVIRDGAGFVWLRYGSKLFKVGSDGRPVLVPGDVPAQVVPCAAAGAGVWRFDGHSAMTLVGGARPRSLELRSMSKLDGEYGCAADGEGGLWVDIMHSGIVRLSTGTSTAFALPPAARRNAYSFATSPDGQAYFYTGSGDLWRSDGARPRAVLQSRQLSIGHIHWLMPGATGILMGGPGGLGLLDRSGLRTLSRDRFPWLSFSAGGVQTARGETWIQTPQTIVRVATSELDRAFADEHYQPAVQLFDIMDGLPGSATFFNRSGLTEDPQGRIWVATDHGIAVADPHALPHNPLAPPVAITAVRTAGGLWSNQGKVELPPATTRVEIDFTGLSFVNPERLCFRYRLSGVDRSWVDTGNRRQALYTNLAPGQYRFQVIAANNDGVWNAQGASLDIVIRPTFFASPLAYILGAVVLMALASTLYLLRMRAVAANVRSKIAIRIHERERIARDLHDTLLQSVQGVFLRFQAFSDHLAKDDPAREKLEDTLERAQQVVDEARDRVFALRDPGDRIPVEEIVAQAMATIPLFTTARVETRIASHLPALRIELAKEAQAILSEALFNVERHACATHVIICAEGGDRRIRLSVRDDGKGIPADIIEAGERPGHFGLIGMRERARHIDGYLSIANLSGRGAEIVLSFPCADLAGAKGLQDTVHVLGRWLRRHLLRK